MTLSILDINGLKHNKQALKTAIVYFAVAVFCFIFNKVYAIFGHGVSSDSMTRMFLYPLLGGVLIYTLLWLFMNHTEKVPHYRFFFNSYNSGIAALTVKSLLFGILEIAGTSSPYLIAFTACGWMMVGLGLTGFIWNFIRGCRKQKGGMPC